MNMAMCAVGSNVLFADGALFAWIMIIMRPSTIAANHTIVEENNISGIKTQQLAKL